MLRKLDVKESHLNPSLDSCYESLNPLICMGSFGVFLL